MERKTYTEAELEIMKFGDDIIVTSGDGDGDGDVDEGEDSL